MTFLFIIKWKAHLRTIRNKNPFAVTGTLKENIGVFDKVKFYQLNPLKMVTQSIKWLFSVKLNAVGKDALFVVVYN